MSRNNLFAVALAGAVLLVASAGCGGGARPTAVADPTARAKEKVAAFNRLADELAKDAGSVNVAGALEEYRTIEFSAEASPQEAEEIVRIYRQRIQGKHGGPHAQEIQGEIAAVQAALKRKK